MRRIILLLSIFFTGMIHAPAQLYRQLDTRDGLSSRRALSIEKDKKGYMWILTHEGIDKYNGKQFIHYKFTIGDQLLQQFPNLNTLQIDTQGRIWAFGKNGYVFNYNTEEDRFVLHLDFCKATQTRNRLPLTHIKIDNSDNLWLCTKTNQYIYQTQTKDFIQLDSPIKEEITYLTQENDNNYYIGTNHNIYQAELNGNRLNIKTDSLLENFYIIQYLYFHRPTENLIIGTLMDGFYLYNQKKQTLEALGNMKDVSINMITPVPDSQEEVLIATDGNGVYRLNLTTKELLPYFSTNHEDAYKMNGNIVKDIYIDDENRTWMIIYPFGITVYSDKYPGYELLQHSKENPNSLVSSQVTYIMEDSDGDIWFATANGVCCYQTRTRKWTSLLSSYQQDKQEQNYVFISLCEAAPGTILVGGYMSGMYRIDKKDMVPHYFSPQTLGWANIRPDKYIRSIYRDKEGYIWAGGYYNFKRIDPITFHMEHYDVPYPITYITSKDKDELWIGTINGLYQFNKRQRKWKQVKLSDEIGSINIIYQDSNQNTYIGTNGSGMWVFNNQTEKLENYITTNSALICNNIYCILPTRNENELIISTENELACFNTEEKIFLNWTQEQGLLSTKFNTASGIRTSNGKILFGSGNGVIAMNDSVSLPRIFNSKMVFTDLNIHYQKVVPGTEDSPLTRSIDETEKITLSHKQNIFSLDVSSINYDCPSRILYSWMLEGFFNEWTVPNDLHLIRYTNIDPGTYTLKVRAILKDDGHTLEERSIRIIITPPFSQSIWAMLIYVILLLSIVAAIMRFLWLKKDSDTSREKIQFFINTAHDIRTPLTLIKAPLSDMERNEELSKQGQTNLQLAIRSTDRLSELATKLIDFQKEELYTSDINVNLIEINRYVNSFLEQFRLYAEKKNIRLLFVGNEEPFEAWIDRNKLDSIIHNLISNALKYTPDGGEIRVRVKSNKDHWFLKIADTGIGISAADQKKMFKHLFRGDNAVNSRITGTGIGMLQTYKLVKRHLGRISVNSKENEGTTFRLRFPLDNKRYKHHDEYVPESGQQIPIIKEETAYHPVKIQETTVPSAFTLLIVEDNTELRSFLCQTLSEHYRIMEATNGQEALDKIAEKQPDLVLSDIMMPVMRGDDLCRVLKSNMETSHIPVILLTALNDKDSIIHGLETKADNYLVKPFDIEILKASIDSVLANKELIRQRFAQLNYHTDDIKEEVPGIDLDQEFLLKVNDTVKKNLSNDFNVDILCAKLHMSRSSFYNKIKALTGQSPSDFVRQIRMNEAALLLRSRKYTVAEVSDLLGYGDPKYFTDIFKKHYGMTPSAYIKQEKTS